MFQDGGFCIHYFLLIAVGNLYTPPYQQPPPGPGCPRGLRQAAPGDGACGPWLHRGQGQGARPQGVGTGHTGGPLEWPGVGEGVGGTEECRHVDEWLGRCVTGLTRMGEGGGDQGSARPESGTGHTGGMGPGRVWVGRR